MGNIYFLATGATFLLLQANFIMECNDFPYKQITQRAKQCVAAMHAQFENK